MRFEADGNVMSCQNVSIGQIGWNVKRSPNVITNHPEKNVNASDLNSNPSDSCSNIQNLPQYFFGHDDCAEWRLSVLSSSLYRAGADRWWESQWIPPSHRLQVVHTPQWAVQQTLLTCAFILPEAFRPRHAELAALLSVDTLSKNWHLFLELKAKDKVWSHKSFQF